ncbi:MAG TPA: quinolinate synthase NadA [Bacteroidetes bacterium]|nr:quinolinate synthase NadA [Bacteroidota bacterium]
MGVDIREILQKGYIDLPVEQVPDLREEIEKLKRKKNAVILAHYYEDAAVQDIADYVGDSLDLSRKAAETDAQIIVFAGVHFMAETAKILSPQKKVILPHMKAGCSLADSCPVSKFKKFIEEHAGYTVISYVNTTADIKTVTDIACTSSNALKIVQSLPENEKILFGPDRNLGEYIRNKTGRDILIWNGHCHVHERFSPERMKRIVKKYPEAKIVAHPECKQEVQEMAVFIGSTSQMLKFVQEDDGNIYIIATEPGIIHQMKKKKPEKIYIPAPPADYSKDSSICEYMKMIDLKNIYLSLTYELPEITLEAETIEKAARPIRRMLEISDKNGI